MNCDLKGLKESNRWKRDLYGFVLLEDKKLKDEQVRLIVEKGIENGYKTLYDIPDEIAKKWLKEQSK